MTGRPVSRAPDRGAARPEEPTPGSPAPANAPPRIVEIGEGPFLAAAFPDAVDFFASSPKPKGDGRVLGPLRFLRLLAALRRGEVRLLAIHATKYSRFGARNVLTALRDWHWRAPLGLFALMAPRWLLRGHAVPVAGLDLGDSFGIGRHDFALLDRSVRYFKRELPSDRWQAFFGSGHPDNPGRRWRAKEKHRRRLAKLLPISVGTWIWPGHAPTVGIAKTTDVFFAGDRTGSTSRQDGLAEIERLRAEGLVVDLPGPMSAPEYARRMAAAWLAWSPAGYGWDCYRHYEAAAVGTVPLMPHPTIHRHAPMIEGEHCLFYPVEPGGLAAAVRAALADKPRLARMGAAARDHVHAHHTLEARAAYVVRTMLGEEAALALTAGNATSAPASLPGRSAA